MASGCDTEWMTALQQKASACASAASAGDRCVSDCNIVTGGSRLTAAISQAYVSLDFVPKAATDLITGSPTPRIPTSHNGLGLLQ